MGKAYLYNYEDGTPKSLPDPLSLVTDCYKTPIKRLQDSINSYKSSINLL